MEMAVRPTAGARKRLRCAAGTALFGNVCGIRASDEGVRDDVFFRRERHVSSKR